jgi:hypothetical protein
MRSVCKVHSVNCTRHSVVDIVWFDFCIAQSVTYGIPPLITHHVIFSRKIFADWPEEDNRLERVNFCRADTWPKSYVKSFVEIAY